VIDSGGQGEAGMAPDRIEMPPISLIVARSVPQRIIGCDNRLPWRLPSDLKRFRALTTGRAILMGRKTFESIGRPLPNRENIVLSRTPGENAAGLFWAGTRESAILLADRLTVAAGKETFFVIGGDKVYRSFFEDGLVDRIYLTEVLTGPFQGGAAFFPYDLDPAEWKIVGEEKPDRGPGDEFEFRFVTCERRVRRVRTRDSADFLPDGITRV
jgi:dihydrofolate reductase